MTKLFRNLASTLFCATAATALCAFPVKAEVVYETETELGHSLNLPIYCWKDNSKPVKAIILAIHGATLYAGTFDETATHLAAEGYIVYATDMRGFGRWQNESDLFHGDNGVHYSQSKEDLLVILSRLRQDYPEAKIFPMGESVGANLAIWVAANEPKFIDGAIVSSPCIKSIMHPSAKMAIDATRGFFSPNKKYTLRPYIAPYLSEDARVTKAYMKDPVIMHGMSPVELIKCMKTNKQALVEVKDIPADLPLLIMAGRKDEIYSAKAVPNLVNEMGSHYKTMMIEPDKGHLLLETKYVEPGVLTLIDDWLAKATIANPARVLDNVQTSQASDVPGAL